MGNAEGSLDLEKRLFMMNVECKKTRAYEARSDAHRAWAINMPYSGDLGQYGRDRGYEIVYT
jgi:hypothetical protein